MQLHDNSKLLKKNPSQCPLCFKRFRTPNGVSGHSKKHYPEAIEAIRKSRMGSKNPAKRLDVRKKISKAGMGKIPWNKNKSWVKDKRHNRLVNSSMKKYRKNGIKTFTMDFYIPDAIIIDFNKRIVKAFEFNPGSVISKGTRAKKKGYDSLIVKIRRQKKYAHKNTDSETPIDQF